MMHNTLLLYILFTSNNIFFVLLNLNGTIIFWTSSGRTKIKGLKKITLNSIKISLNIVMLTLFKTDKIINLHLKLKGLNKFKKILLKQLKSYPINFISIFDETISAHNGCKNKKSRKI